MINPSERLSGSTCRIPEKANGMQDITVEPLVHRKAGSEDFALDRLLPGNKTLAVYLDRRYQREGRFAARWELGGRFRQRAQFALDGMQKADLDIDDGSAPRTRHWVCIVHGSLPVRAANSRGKIPPKVQRCRFLVAEGR